MEGAPITCAISPRVKRFSVEWTSDNGELCSVQVDAHHHVDALIAASHQHRDRISAGTYITAIAVPEPLAQQPDEFDEYTARTATTPIDLQLIDAVRDLRARIAKLEG